VLNLNIVYLSGRPWAVTPEIAALGAELLGAEGTAALRRIAEIHAAVGTAVAAAGDGLRRSAGQVAVLPIVGLLTHRGGMVESARTTSTAAVGEAVSALAADPAVASIVLEVDSPGGEVAGTIEAGDVIRAAARSKPIVAIANSYAGSSAYWLASQASELFVTPSGQVGGIGVFSAHEDQSKAIEAKGRRVTLISAGKYKTEGNPYEPLGDEARAARQATVDHYYGLFVKAVARGRGVAPEAVREGFGQGRMVAAQAAVEQGMADRVGTLDDAIRRAAALAGERRRGMSALASAEVARAKLAL
jgi:signal peptide peptidase SppA